MKPVWKVHFSDRLLEPAEHSKPDTTVQTGVGAGGTYFLPFEKGDEVITPTMDKMDMIEGRGMMQTALEIPDVIITRFRYAKSPKGQVRSLYIIMTRDVGKVKEMARIPYPSRKSSGG